MTLVVCPLLFVSGHVAVGLGVFSALFSLSFAGVVEPVLVGAAVLGGIGQSVGHRALGRGLQNCKKLILSFVINSAAGAFALMAVKTNYQLIKPKNDFKF